MTLNINNMIGLDFETYSDVDLPKHGLERYVNGQHFTPLMCSISKAHGPRGETVSSRWVDLIAGNNRSWLADSISHKYIVAHNAGFEQRVLRAIGIDVPSHRFIDSAVIARGAGAGGSLEAAAPQLLGTNKIAAGKDLVKLFSIPGKYQEANGNMAFDLAVIEDHPDEWIDFGRYCEVDSELGLRLVIEYLGLLGPKELENQAITMDMNNRGWHVDIAKVEEMNRRYLENLEAAEEKFRLVCNAPELNLNSLKQLKEWCADRGIRATSFDEKKVSALIARIQKKLDSGPLPEDKAKEYFEVQQMLRTKQILGGSSLKKLQVILDTTCEDGRLRDQYLHIGASQSYRTTGRSVQMQNLKRLATPADMEELEDLDSEWDNEKLAENLRQVFTSSHPQGALIVGDFSSVEGRGLAWLADAIDKLNAFRNGLDIYKVGAAKQYSVPYDQVTKDQRQFGKVGELSCGYQAGPGAVKSFAAGMGVELSEGEASKIVTDWRSANPKIVEFWWELDDRLHKLLDSGLNQVMKAGPNGHWVVGLSFIDTPQSLLKQHPNARSIEMYLKSPTGEKVLRRFFHGVYRRGKDVCYYKPSQRKTGDLWSARFTDPKTKQIRYYNIYGGKLTGILTQSLCREIFFMSLRRVVSDFEPCHNVKVIGQFHDEIVLDWTPTGSETLASAKSLLESCMSDEGIYEGFPLAADVKHDYRYTK